MDTLTHALSGALLARAVTRPADSGGAASRRRARIFGPPVPAWQAVVAGLVAATFPDADFVLRYVSDIAYLKGHRGVTHSLLMLPLWSLLLGALLALAFRSPPAWKRFAWISAAAIAIHIAGDWITQFGTMLLAPLSDARFGLGSTFIIDLTVTGIIAAGLVGSAVFARSRIPATVALGLLPVWVGVSLYGKSEAIEFGRQYAAARGMQAVTIDAAPRPASPFNWSVVVFDGAAYHVAHVNTRRSELLRADRDDNFVRRLSAPYQPLAQAQWQTRRKFGDVRSDDFAREVWTRPEFEFFRWFALYPLLDRVDTAGADSCAWFRDLRFEFPGRERVPFRFGLCRDGERQWRLYALGEDGRSLIR